MFGLFNKAADKYQIVLVAVSAATLLWEIEIKNGGMYTDPKGIPPVIRAIAKQDGIFLDQKTEYVAVTCCMAFLVDQKLVNKFLKKKYEGVGDFKFDEITDAETAEMLRIVKDFF